MVTNTSLKETLKDSTKMISQLILKPEENMRLFTSSRKSKRTISGYKTLFNQLMKFQKSQVLLTDLDSLLNPSFLNLVKMLRLLMN